MNFKDGTLVKISPKSKHFRDQGGHGTGTVKSTKCDDPSYIYIVHFKDGYYNNYRHKDLIRVNTAPLFNNFSLILSIKRKNV